MGHRPTKCFTININHAVDFIYMYQVFKSLRVSKIINYQTNNGQVAEKYFMSVAVSSIPHWSAGHSFLMDKLKFHPAPNVKTKIHVQVHLTINLPTCYGDSVVTVTSCILDWYIRCNVFNIVIKL